MSRDARLAGIVLVAVLAVALVWPAVRGLLLGMALFVLAGAGLVSLSDRFAERRS